MTKVKFVAETGAELRQQMLDFLGLGAIKGEVVQTILERSRPVSVMVPTEEKLVDTVEGAEATDTLAEETPKTRKRRSKAEIEAEKAEQANGPAEDAHEANGVEITPVSETAPVVETSGPKITKESLTPLVLTRGRAGKKAEVIALLSQFVQADGTSVVTGLPNLQESDYQAFHDEIVKI